MVPRSRSRRPKRRGIIAVMAALLIAILAGTVAFAVDYGYLLKVRTDLQRAADAAALAATQDLIRKDDGTQDLDQVRATAREYARTNLGDASFQIPDADIEIGRYDPATIYSSVTLLNTGTFDTVRLTLRRDGVNNPRASLFFARVLGRQEADVTASATAALQKARIMLPGADILPFATPKDLWDGLVPGEQWSAYGDGKLKDESGNDIPGNWGTLDVGETDNSTSDLNDQILHGLRQTDLDALMADGRTSQAEFLDSADATWMNGDAGLSSGVKGSILQIEGKYRLIPIFDQMDGQMAGENLDFRVIEWGVVKVIDSEWQGAQNTRVIVQKSHAFMGELRANPTLGAGGNDIEYIDGAYTSPVLIE